MTMILLTSFSHCVVPLYQHRNDITHTYHDRTHTSLIGQTWRGRIPAINVLVGTEPMQGQIRVNYFLRYDLTIFKYTKLSRIIHKKINLELENNQIKF